jgi:shikimate kinase
LLASGDPLAAARRLLAARTPLYARADLVVDTDGRTVPQIADSILDELRARGAGTGSTTG